MTCALYFSSYGVHFSVSLVQYDIFTVTAIKECAAIAALIVATAVYKKVKYRKTNINIINGGQM